MPQGFVYILISPNSNYIKIGGTEHSITKRLREINGTISSAHHFGNETASSSSEGGIESDEVANGSISAPVLNGSGMSAKPVFHSAALLMQP